MQVQHVFLLMMEEQRASVPPIAEGYELPAGARCTDCNVSTQVCETVLRCKITALPSETLWHKPLVSGMDNMRERRGNFCLKL